MTTGTEMLGGEPAPAAPVIEGAAAPIVAAPAVEPAPADAKWYSGLPADRHGYIENKGWADPNAVIDSYTNLEKTLGLPADARADALLVVPKGDAKPEERDAFLTKAVASFVPESPDKYDFGLKPEQMTPEIEQSAGWMHKAGVPQPIAAKLVAEALAANAARETAFTAQSLQDVKDLTAEYGDKFGDFEVTSRMGYNAVKEGAGLTDEHLNAIERAIGTKTMLKVFGTIGKNLTELPGPGGEAKTGGAAVGDGGFKTSPAQADAKIQALFKDSEFMSRYNSPNMAQRQTAIAEMEALQKIKSGTA